VFRLCAWAQALVETPGGSLKPACNPHTAKPGESGLGGALLGGAAAEFTACISLCATRGGRSR